MPQSQVAEVTLVADADTYLDQTRPDENYGPGESLEIRSWLTQNARALLSFDLSTVPPGAAVTKARFLLHVGDSSSPDRTYQCHRITTAWEEDSVSWSSTPQTISRYMTEAPIETSAGGVTWDVTEQVRQLLIGIREHAWINHGWMIMDKAEDSEVSANVSFVSRESLVEEKRPYLTFSFVPPKLNLTSEVTSRTVGNWVRMTVSRISQDGVTIIMGDRTYKKKWIDIGDLKVKLSSSSPSGRFSLTVDGEPVSEVLIPDNSTKVSFYYLGDTVGNHVISVNTDDYPQGYYEGDSRTLAVIEDVYPPEISDMANVPESPAMGESIRISATIRDVGSGVKDVILHYSTSGGAAWKDLEMTPRGDTYAAQIPGQNLFSEVMYYIEASDFIGNSAETSVERFTVGVPIWVYAAVGVGVIAIVLIVARLLRRE